MNLAISIRKFKEIILKFPPLSITLFFILSRVILKFFYSFHSYTCSDSTDYIALARRLTNIDLSGYWFERTPGYPFLIALSKFHFYRLANIQVLLSYFTVLLLYRIARKTFSTSLSILIAIIPCFILNFHFYERMILSENLAVFLLMGICYLFYSKRSSYLTFLAIGILCAYLLLTRTLFIYLVPLFVVVYLFENHLEIFKRKIISILLLTLPTLLVYLLWSGLNKQETGYYTLTNYLGINLAQTSVTFFESDQEDTSLIKSIYVKHINIAKKGESGEIKNAVWDAYDELLEETQMSMPELSNELKKKSIKLILNNKIKYLKQVTVSWKDFWKNKMYCIFVNTTFLGEKPFSYWKIASHYLQITFHFLFIIASLFFTKRVLINKERIPVPIYTSILIVVLGSFLQAAIIYGDNPRFSFPFYPLIYLVVIFFFNTLINRFRNEPQNKINVSK